MPRFSVIIPTHNRCELLKEALASLWVQTFTDYEVIVIDDGSSDGTWEYLQSVGPRIRAFRQPNNGPGAARNLGAKHATGAYLALLDSDDLWLPWTLKVYDKLISKYDSPAIVSGSITPFTDKSDILPLKEWPVQADIFPDYVCASSSGYFVGGCMAVLRRDKFLQAGGFTDKPINLEDHDLILKMGDGPGFVQVRAPITVGWRRHGGSATMSVSRSIEGCLFLIEQERCAAYPGAHARARRRREIITSHIRPVALECLRSGLRKEAWALYRSTLCWHVSLHRWKFLVGFWVRFILAPI